MPSVVRVYAARKWFDSTVADAIYRVPTHDTFLQIRSEGNPLSSQRMT
jgi:hypothetical protein